MYSLLPVLNIFSRILFAFAFVFLVPLAWAWSEDHEQYRFVWEGAMAFAAFSGVLLWALTRRHTRELQARDGFMLVNLVWIVLPAYSAVPLMYIVPDITWTKA